MKLKDVVKIWVRIIISSRIYLFDKLCQQPQKFGFVKLLGLSQFILIQAIALDELLWLKADTQNLSFWIF